MGSGIWRGVTCKTYYNRWFLAVKLPRATVYSSHAACFWLKRRCRDVTACRHCGRAWVFCLPHAPPPYHYRTL